MKDDGRGERSCLPPAFILPPSSFRGEAVMVELRIFLADDHAVVREGLKSLVNGAPGMVVCGEAGDGLGACEQIERLLPDVAVLDVSMPNLGGADATARLKQSCPQVKVLALTV